jgi:hypothetical protein
MASKINKIAGIATFGALLGLATAVSADDPKKATMQLPPKSCTWMGAGDRGAVVPSGAYHRDDADKSLWKCTNGSWSQVRTPPPKKGAKT